MIAELAGIISSQHTIFKPPNIPKHTLPCASYETENHQSLQNRKGWATTDASRGFIVASSVQTISIPRRHRLEQTMSQFLCGGMHRPCCDLSMDQGERVSFEGLSSAFRLHTRYWCFLSEWQH